MEKFKSSVWRYFKICEDDEKKAECLLCESNMPTASMQIIRGKTPRSYSTTPLWNHLEWRHPEFHKGAKAQAQAEKSNDEEDPLSLSTPNAAGKKEKPHARPNLQNSTRKKLMWSLDDRRSMDISNAILQMMALDAEPFSLVEREGFTRLIRCLAPQYPLSNEIYFSKNVMPRVIETLRGKIMAKMSTASFISFTTDVWTDETNNESFMSLNGHCLSPVDMQREVFTLQVKHLTSCTAHDVYEAFSDAVTEWEIPNEKVHLIVRDDAANVDPETNLMVAESVGCFVSALKLVVQDATFMHRRSVVEILEKYREIVSHFGNSSLASSWFRPIQDSLRLPSHELTQNESSSWNPTFSMLLRLRQQRDTLIAYAAEHDIPALTTHQWNMVDRVSRVLEPFEEIAKQAAADHETIGFVIPAVATLSSCLSKRTKDAGTLMLKQELKDSLHNRFLNSAGLNVQNSRSFVLATFLDPRYKARFLKDVETARGWTMDELASANRGDVDALDASSSSLREVIGDVQEDVWKCFDEIAYIAKSEREDSIDDHYGAANTDPDVFGFGLHLNGGSREEVAVYNEELERYLAQPLLPRQEDPLLWWRQHCMEYPRLMKLALKYLSAPASSPNSRRPSSPVERIYTENRNRLTPQNAEMLLFVVKNMRMMDVS